MLEFKKYGSIENSFNKIFMEYVTAEMPADLEYVVQEKVHGANTSFLCDGESIRFAKRTSVLEAEESFYDYPELLDRYKERVVALTKELMAIYADVRSIAVFGEMFGGTYPHKDVLPNRELSPVQKGIFYTPGHEFYAFDICVISDEGSRYLPLDEVNELFEKHGFFYAKTLFRGTLGECLDYPNAFQSKIADWLGLPAIEDNICEGVVIRPVIALCLRSGKRVLIKNKNERFAEKKSVKRRTPLFADTVSYSEALNSLLAELETYVTEQRLTNVVSHIGEIQMSKDFGKVMGSFSKDVLDDFLKEHQGEYGALEKEEQKLFKKELNRFSMEVVRRICVKQTASLK